MRTEEEYLKTLCHTPISDGNCLAAIPQAPLGALTEALEHCIRMDEKTKYTKIAAELRRRYRESDDPDAATEIPKWEDARKTARNSFEQLENAVTSGDSETVRHAIMDATIEDLQQLDQEYDLAAIAETMEGTWAENLDAEVGRRLGAPIARATTPTLDWTPDDGQAYEYPVDKIDGQSIDLQQRADAIDHEHVDDLKAVLEEGGALHAIDIYVDMIDKPGPGYSPIGYIADGWHRYLAYALSRKFKTIPARIHSGGKEAAFVASLSANAKQMARPRRRADVRKAVIAALEKWYFVDLSQCDKLPKPERKTMQEIAEICATTKQSVSRIAADLEKQAAAKSKAATAPATGQGSATGTQIDFWDQFKEEASEVIDGFRRRIADANTLRRFEEEPERTAEEFEALADALQHEATEIRKTAKSIRTGLKA